MPEYTPRWIGMIRGFRTSGRDPWQVSIEMPEGPGIYAGTGPTVMFDRGQTVHVLTDEGIAEVERAAAEKAWGDGYDDGVQRGIGLESTGHLLTRRHELGPIPLNPYRRNKGECDD